LIQLLLLTEYATSDQKSAVTITKIHGTFWTEYLQKYKC